MIERVDFGMQSNSSGDYVRFADLRKVFELIDDMRCQFFDIRDNVCEDEGKRIDTLISRAEEMFKQIGY